MKKQIWLAGGAFVAMAWMGAVHAHDRVQWSLSVGSQPRGVVMVPQTQYSYGAPPSVYTPPPPVYVQPPPVYVQPAPVYGPPPVVYVQPGPVYINPPVRIESYPHRHQHQRWNGDRDGRWGYGSDGHYGSHGHYRR